jgi:hypothetical protein
LLKEGQQEPSPPQKPIEQRQQQQDLGPHLVFNELCILWLVGIQMYSKQVPELSPQTIEEEFGCRFQKFTEPIKEIFGTQQKIEKMEEKLSLNYYPREQLEEVLRKEIIQ